MTNTPIEDYFLIGDLHSSALVSSDGSIDWLCWPHFDDPSVFGRILDENAGHFSLEGAGVEQCSYEAETAIVVHECGSFRMQDLMLPRPSRELETNHLLVRHIEALEDTTVEFAFSPRADYAQSDAVATTSDGVVAFDDPSFAGTVQLHLPENTEISQDDTGMVHLEISLRTGQQVQLGLEYIPDGGMARFLQTEDYLNKTRTFWHNWISHGEYPQRDRSLVVRSAITLKLLQFRPTGAIVAAPTTSLPEDLGGMRNWDYRYIWIRDAAYTLYAFHVLGYDKEARDFFDFIQHIAQDCSDYELDLRLMYDIHGNEAPREQELAHLSGYEDSQPVRIGNGAALQYQLDIYGALIDAYYFGHKHVEELHESDVNIVLALVNRIREEWQTPDHGIWEIRDKQRHYTFSKVMAWVGADRARELIPKMTVVADQELELQRCEALADEIEEWLWEHTYDAKHKSFYQYPDSGGHDATMFLFVLLKFLDKHDEKTKAILQSTMDELADQSNAFVDRYNADDNLEGDEGAFTLCSWWLISAWAILEEVELAEELFQNFRKHIAPHGLIAEEIADDGRYLGNYPQTFSHAGLIMTVYYLERYAE